MIHAREIKLTEQQRALLTSTATHIPGVAKRPPGRPEVSEVDRLKVGTIRLTEAQWTKLAALGGAAWLRKKIDQARPA